MAASRGAPAIGDKETDGEEEQGQTEEDGERNGPERNGGGKKGNRRGEYRGAERIGENGTGIEELVRAGRTEGNGERNREREKEMAGGYACALFSSDSIFKDFSSRSSLQI